MGYTRRGLLVAGATVALAGCGGEGFAGSATPRPASFEVTADGDAVELRYTGAGAQDPARFRVVLDGAGAADGTYDLAALTDDQSWTAGDRYVLNRTTLGLASPLAVEGLRVELQYDDDGEWRTVRRTNPAD